VDSFCSIALLALERKKFQASFGKYPATMNAVKQKGIRTKIHF
jgi:hypothetical protein